MFGIDSIELAVIAVVALLVIGPKELPRVLRHVGEWVGKARGMARHVRTGFDAMIRESELEEMQKQWAKQNADIMAASTIDLSAEMAPLAKPGPPMGLPAPAEPDAPPAVGTSDALPPAIVAADKAA